MWGPANCENPFHNYGGRGIYSESQRYETGQHDGFEVGVDSLLEALKAKGIHIKKAREGWANITVSFGEIATDMGIINKAGWIVFIPDERG